MSPNLQFVENLPNKLEMPWIRFLGDALISQLSLENQFLKSLLRFENLLSLLYSQKFFSPETNRNYSKLNEDHLQLLCNTRFLTTVGIEPLKRWSNILTRTARK